MILGTALIVLSWVVFHSILLWPVAVCVLLTIVGAIFILVGLLFLVYFFNLDMKLMAAIQPLFLKIYDKRKRDRRL